jgi:hypothetical protein
LLPLGKRQQAGGLPEALFGVRASIRSDIV